MKRVLKFILITKQITYYEVHPMLIDDSTRWEIKEQRRANGWTEIGS